MARRRHEARAEKLFKALVCRCDELDHPAVPITGIPPTFPIRGHLSNGMVHYLDSLSAAEKARVIAHELAHLFFPGDEEGAEATAFLALERTGVEPEAWFPAHMRRASTAEMRALVDQMPPERARGVRASAEIILPSGPLIS